jgi:hypothetical protein
MIEWRGFNRPKGSLDTLLGRRGATSLARFSKLLNLAQSLDFDLCQRLLTMDWRLLLWLKTSSKQVLLKGQYPVRASWSVVQAVKNLNN